MYAEERRETIVDRARRDGRVEVAALATDLDVTTETIRRDLTELEQLGLLRRVHGGAIPADRLRIERAVADRAQHAAAEKARIAKAALAHVPTRATILLDAGTTTQALAALLPDDRHLTVVTNSLPIATDLAAHQDTEVHLLGGRVRGRTLATVDDWAQRALADLAPDLAFVAANGVSAGRGLTTPDPAEAAVKRAMVRAGRRVVLLADHTKLGEDHFVRFADLGDLDLLVTDSGADQAACDALVAAAPGLEVVRA
jgi:DeoR family transcriptional regulator, fructose operon transcriptional repressor